MAVSHHIKKWHSNFKGLDKRSSALAHSSEYATGMQNALYRKSGAINKRPGYHGNAPIAGGYGLTTFNNFNTSTGATTQEIVVLDQNLHKRVEQTLTITYSGGDQTEYSIELDPITKKFTFKLYVGGEQYWQTNLGNGIEDNNPISNLALLINDVSVTDFTASFTGTGTTSSAFLKPTTRTPLSNNTVDLKYNEYTQITSIVTNPFTLSKDSSEFENATFASIRNVLYIASENNPLMKYDGETVYKAGMKKGAAPTQNSVGTTGGSLVNGYYLYRVTYEHQDAKNNLVQGTISDHLQVQLTGGTSTQKTTLNLTSILSTEGYDTSDPSKLKIKIWRTNKMDTINTGEELTLTYYLAGSVNNGTATFEDTTASSVPTTTTFYTFPSNDPDVPPTDCKYVVAYQGMLILSGRKSKPNTVYYSDSLTPEGFPEADNNFTVSSGNITGISPLEDTLFVFHKNSIHAITGEIESDIFKVNLISAEGAIGCESHHSIQELQGNLIFLSEKGIYNVDKTGKLNEASFIIASDFKSLTKTFNFKKAVAFNWVDKDLYILHLPVEVADNSGSLTSSSDSEIFVFDYFKKAWLKWKDVNISGGISAKGNEINFVERRLDKTTGTLEHVGYSFSDSSSTTDYNDHHNPISFIYTTNWETMGQPTIFKKFLRLKLYAIDSEEDFESPSFNLKAEIQKDFSNVSQGIIDFDFGQGAGGWGLFKWGSGIWGSTTLIQLKSKLPTGKSKSLRVSFTNDTANENILLTGYEMEIAMPYKTEIKE